MGRSLTNSLHNLEIKGTFHEALKQLGYSLEDLVEKERDAALGNGGLGRLAACFLDSMASENLPAWGYGIRYQYGMFRQEIHEGFQHENPDYWLNFGNPWEIERPGIAYPIKFYGHVTIHDVDGRQAFKWESGEEVTAVAYDTPIPGWNTPNTINMRLWSAKPSREFDLESFNTGDYVQAILAKQRAETISAVLYPDDRTYQGKELRLKQQFFMVSATLQDIIRRYLVTHKDESFEHFPEKVALQLNDTHPTIGVPELMRLLMDEHGLGWTKSWDITTRVFSFTNHTVLPEALEKWPVELVENVLPRHMQIIYDINWRFTQELRGIMGDDYDRIGRMSIIEEGEGFDKSVRMAHLALVASHTVNGVAAIHSELIKTTIFKEFYDVMPEKFQNKTNGVTQRRWLAFCNPRAVVAHHRDARHRRVGEGAGSPAGFAPARGRPGVPEALERYQGENKQKLADLIKQKTGVEVPTNALFDIQVKRIHEYKRQLLNVFGIIHRYNALKAMSPDERKKQVPRVCIVGGKAAPGYDMAKRIIKLVSAVGDTVNKDPDIGDLLKVVFIPDYNVSSAEVIMPGAELSQHISTAGTEASGTSNMKFAMNGCLIIGTMDGANVEIAEEIGEGNMFIFGHSADVVPSLRREREYFNVPEDFYKIVDQIRSGVFGWEDFFNPVCDAVCGGADYYLLANDFDSYIDAQRRVDEAYADQGEVEQDVHPPSRVPESSAATAPSASTRRTSGTSSRAGGRCPSRALRRRNPSATRRRCERRRARWTRTGRPARRLKKKYSCFTATHRRTEPAPTNPARPTTRSRDTSPALTTLPRICSPPSPRRTSRDRVGVPSANLLPRAPPSPPALESAKPRFAPRAPRRVPDDPRVPPRDVPARLRARHRARLEHERGVVSLPGARVRRSTRRPLRGRWRRPRAREHLRRRRRVSIVNPGASRHEHGRDKLGARARVPDEAFPETPPDLRVAASPSAAFHVTSPAPLMPTPHVVGYGRISSTCTHVNAIFVP